MTKFNLKHLLAKCTLLSSSIGALFSVSTLSSCQQHSNNCDFKFISKSDEFCINNDDIIIFQCSYTNARQNPINKINNIELESENNLLVIAGKSTNLPVDRNGHFTFSVRFKDTQTRSLSCSFNLRLSFTQNDKEITQKWIDPEFVIGYDVHSITFNSSADEVFEQHDNKMTCHMLFVGEHIPSFIRNCELVDGQEYWELAPGQDFISIGANGEFVIQLIKKDEYKHNNVDELPFSIKTYYQIKNISCSFVSKSLSCPFYKTKVTLVSYSDNYLFELGDQCTLKLKFPNIEETPQKINRVSFKNNVDNYLSIVNSTNIPVDQQTGTFFVTVKLSHQPLKIQYLHSFDLWLDYNINQTHLSNIENDTPLYMHLIDAPDYGNDCISIYPIDSITFTVETNDISSAGNRIDNLHLKYKIGTDGSWHDYDHNTGEIQIPSEEPLFLNAQPSDHSWSNKDTQCWIGIHDGMFVLGGNASRLIDPNGFTAFNEETSIPYTLMNLFQSSTVGYIQKDFLEIENVPEYGYYGMFNNCYMLANCPNLLANNINRGSYSYMFQKCANLNNCLENLPVENVPPEVYYKMFSGCESLTGPISIGVKNINDHSLSYMFENCKQLNSISLPNYIDDFDIYPRWEAFSSWVQGVAPNGELYYNGNDNIRGDNSIPLNWKVIRI